MPSEFGIGGLAVMLHRTVAPTALPHPSVVAGLTACYDDCK